LHAAIIVIAFSTVQATAHLLSMLLSTTILAVQFSPAKGL